MATDKKFKKGDVWKNPQDILYANETEICGWLYKWGFSNTKLLNKMLGTINCGTIKTLQKKQVIMPTATFRSENKFILSLTSNGLAVAESRLEENFEYPELQKEKIVSQNFFHDLYVQTLTLLGMSKGIVHRFATPRMSGLSGKEGEKIPDVIWFDKDDKAIAIEAERNQKYTEHLDNFFGRIVESIEAGNIHECLIIMSSRAGFNNYTAALKRKEITMWTRKAGSPWRFDHNVAVRDEVRSRIQIIHTTELDMSKSVREVTPRGDIEIWLAERSVTGNEGFE